MLRESTDNPACVALSRELGIQRNSRFADVADAALVPQLDRVGALWLVCQVKEKPLLLAFKTKRESFKAAFVNTARRYR